MSSNVKKKVVYLGSKNIGFECLKILHDNSDALNIEILGVDSSSRGDEINKYVNEVGLSHLNKSIPPCDIIISVQYHRILSDIEILMAMDRAINLHMAPLPEYRGCNQFSFAIIDGATEFGATLHEMFPSIDSGPIVAETRFCIDNDVWVKDLFDLTCKESVKLFKESLPILISGDYQAIDQSEFLHQRSSSFHYRSEIQDLKMIDLNWSLDKIEKHLRATMMPGFGCPYIIISGKKVYFQTDEKNN